MHKAYGKYLQFLAADYNILYIGKGASDIYNEISEYFAKASKIDMNEEMLEKISLTISKNQTNIVILDVDKNDLLAIEFFKTLKEYHTEVLIVLLFEPQEYSKLLEIMPFVDASLSYPINNELFHQRIFGVLSIPYTIKSIGRRDLVLKQDNTSEDSMDEFFDIYEGSSLFISDDLLSMVNDLNAGNLSHEFFLDIATKLKEVSDIFTKTEKTNSVSEVFLDLAHYLEKLKLDEIEPANLKAFDYLSNILNDVSIYLLDMFVDRIFKDVYVFEHSLQSNIEFMENALKGVDEDEGELDFF